MYRRSLHSNICIVRPHKVPFALDKQVNENQTAFSRLSALLSGVVVSLAGRKSTTEAQDHVVRMFWSNTLPYLEAIIDQ